MLAQSDENARIKQTYEHPSIVEIFEGGNITWARKILQHYIPDSPASILDIGCGTGGALAEILNSKPHVTHITGIDISEAMIEEAGKRLNDIKAKISPANACRISLIADDFIGHTFAPEEVPNGGFDVIISLYVGQYLPWDLFLKKIHDLAKPGGTIFIIDRIKPEEWAVKNPGLSMLRDFVRMLGFHFTTLHTLPPLSMLTEAPKVFKVYSDPEFLKLDDIHQRNLRTIPEIQALLAPYPHQMTELASDAVLITIKKTA